MLQSICKSHLCLLRIRPHKLLDSMIAEEPILRPMSCNRSTARRSKVFQIMQRIDKTQDENLNTYLDLISKN